MNDMKRVKTTYGSSMIYKMWFSTSRNQLWVQFKKSDTNMYCYSNVTYRNMNLIKGARSVGRMFIQQVKKSGKPFTKVPIVPF